VIVDKALGAGLEGLGRRQVVAVAGIGKRPCASTPAVAWMMTSTNSSATE
jgi:hypothetical protein